jgi:hypothetical protein
MYRALSNEKEKGSVEGAALQMLLKDGLVR